MQPVDGTQYESERAGGWVLLLGLPLLAVLEQRDLAGVIAFQAHLSEHGRLRYLLRSRLERFNERQLLRTDRQVAQLAGTECYARTLELVRSAETVCWWHWRLNVAPVLHMGLRPPLLDGVSRAMEALAAKPREIEAERWERRMSSLMASPNAPASMNWPAAPARLLLDKADALEATVVRRFTGKDEAPPLVSWDDVAERALLPFAKEIVGGTRDVWGGFTVGRPPIGRGELEAVRAGVQRVFDRCEDWELVLAVALAFVGALTARGWEAAADLGGFVVLRRGESEIRPFELITDLNGGTIRADDWWNEAATLGVAELAL